MPQPQDYLVSDIRAASRNLVRQFGLMNRGVAGTDLSLSAAHAIIETGREGQLTAKMLSDKLLLEKSTVSRLIKSLVTRGEVVENRSPDDKRAKLLSLSTKGKQTLAAIDQFADHQVKEALTRLDASARVDVLRSLNNYSQALGAPSVKTRTQIRIETGYIPTHIGRMTAILDGLMNRSHGFDRKFETRITGDMAEFFNRLDSPANQTWRAMFGEQIVGGISIDGEDLDNGYAHLRWFGVENSVQGEGVGERLLMAALEFCDARGYDETHLWTVSGLDAARRLYERHGFELTEEYLGNQWGSEATEQKFVRLHPQRS